MNYWLAKVGCLVLGMGLLLGVHAAPATGAAAEIGYLLEFVSRSGCDFYRNGRWYNSVEAQAHLHDKYMMLSATKQINTAEDFVEKAATRSSLSGLPYKVRCLGGDPMPTRQWLLDALARYRINTHHA